MLHQLSNISSQAMSTLKSKMKFRCFISELSNFTERLFGHSLALAYSPWKTELWWTVSSRHVSLHAQQKQGCTTFGQLHLAWSSGTISARLWTLTWHLKTTAQTLCFWQSNSRNKVKSKTKTKNKSWSLEIIPLINLALWNLFVNITKRKHGREWRDGNFMRNTVGRQWSCWQPWFRMGVTVLDKGLHDLAGLLTWLYFWMVSTMTLGTSAMFMPTGNLTALYCFLTGKSEYQDSWWWWQTCSWQYGIQKESMLVLAE